jgi:hypothetical protein
MFGPAIRCITIGGGFPRANTRARLVVARFEVVVGDSVWRDMAGQRHDVIDAEPARIACLLGALPVLIPLAVAGFSVVALFFLLLNSFDPWLIWPLGAFVALGLVVATGIRSSVAGLDLGLESRICDVLALLGLGAWVGVNAELTSQNVVVESDPGVYSVAGTWLTHHDSIRIPTDQRLWGTDPSTYPDSDGFVRVGDHLYSQGAHLVPAFLGLLGRLDGYGLSSRLNVGIGACALFALYGLARRILRARWALLATVTMAVSLPQLNLIRDTFSEPLAQLFALGGLALVVQAYRTGRAMCWAGAALTLGAVAIARIDGYMLLAALVIPLTVIVASARRGDRKDAVRNCLAAGAGGAVTSVIGLLDLQKLSPSYYSALHSDLFSEFRLLGALLVLGLIVVVVAWRTTLLAKLSAWSRPWRAGVVAALALLALGLLASRPLWQVARAGANPLIAGLQQREGLTQDETRSYNEDTLRWIAWYFGPVTVTLGMVGIALLGGIGVRYRPRDRAKFAVFAVLFIPTVVYLVSSSISPFQPWASRRYVPVIMPAILIGAVLVLQVIWPLRWRSVPVGKVLATVVAAVVAVSPLYLGRSVIADRQYAGELNYIDAACNALPDDAAVVVVGPPRLSYVVSLRAHCDVPGVSLEAPTQEQLAGLVRHVVPQGRALFLVYVPGPLDTVPKDLTSRTTRVATLTTREWNRVVHSIPRSSEPLARALYIGPVASDGTVGGL